MRRLLASLLFVFVVAFAGQAEEAKGLKASLQKFIDDGEIPGVVTFIGTKDGVKDVQVLGMADVEKKMPMTRTTIFRIASMTKPITALAIMLLVQAGLIDVEDPVEKYLPEFKGQMLRVSQDKDKVVLKKPARPIAIKDLLTHTSGLPEYPRGMADIYQKRNYTLSEATAALSQMPLNFEPGSKWSYCNPGIDTLGRIIEVVSGMPFEAFLQSRICQPLGMVDTTSYPNSDQLSRVAMTYGKKEGKLVAMPGGILDYAQGAKHPVPAGGLYSTGDDLAKLYQCVLNKGTANGKKIFDAKLLDEMTQIHTGNGKGGFIDNITWGFGFSVVKDPKGVTGSLSPGSFGHGGAYGTQGWIDPTRGIYTILLIQRTGPNEGPALRKALHDASVSLVK